MYDIDGDKELSIVEVAKMVRGLNQFSGNDKPNQTDETKLTVNKIFAKFDKDEDGFCLFIFKNLYKVPFLEEPGFITV